MGITCGNSSETCFNTFVIIDLVLAVISLLVTVILTILALVAVSSGAAAEAIYNNPDITDADADAALKVAKVLLWVFLVLFILGFLLEFYLFKIARRGIKNKHYGDCQKWFIIRIIFLVLYLIYAIYQLISVVGILNGVINLLSSVYHIYELCVAKAFINELRGATVYSGPINTA